MNATPKSFSLTQLGTLARSQLDAAAKAEAKAGEHYRAAGQYLIEAKAALPHGSWLPWLAEHGIAERQAQRCMQYFETPEAHEEKIQAGRNYRAAAKTNPTPVSDSKPPLVAVSDPDEATGEDVDRILRRLRRQKVSATDIYEHLDGLSFERSRVALLEAQGINTGPWKPGDMPLTEEPCTDCNSEAERWERSCAIMLGELSALRAYWTKEFGDWQAFPIPTSTATLAERAGGALLSLIEDIKRMKTT